MLGECNLQQGHSSTMRQNWFPSPMTLQETNVIQIQTQLSDAWETPALSLSLCLSFSLTHSHTLTLACCILKFPPSPTFTSGPASGGRKKQRSVDVVGLQLPKGQVGWQALDRVHTLWGPGIVQSRATGRFLQRGVRVNVRVRAGVTAGTMAPE